MNNQHQLNFITTKIADLQTAVLHNWSNRVLSIPSGIVNTLHVDEVGGIWFTVSRPMQNITEFDRTFPVELNYHQKGLPFNLTVNGMARMVIDPEEINNLPFKVQTEMKPGRLLICVSITSANYQQYKKADNSKNPFIIMKEYITSLFEANKMHMNFEEKGYAA